MGAIAQFVHSSRKVIVYFTEVSSTLEVRTVSLKVVNRRVDEDDNVTRHRPDGELN